VRRRVSGALPRIAAHTVLVVDDDPAVLTTFERILLRAGFVPLVCASPKVALERCIAERPAVVVSDYSMPGMTGVELAEKIHEALGAEAPPLILATGHALSELPPSRAVLALIKPIGAQELVDAVELLLPEEPTAEER
jgi:CheY-like chemotaxis protein